MITRRAVLLGLGALVAGCGREPPRGTVTIAAGEEGGLYLAFAELIAESARARYSELRVDVLRTEGSVDNLARLRAGRCDFALALADVTEQDRLSRRVGAPVAVARVYENYLQLVVPATSPVRRLADLRGRRISIGASGSGAAATSQVLLRVAGLDDQVQVLRLGLQDALAGLSSGKVDAVVWSGGVPTPAISEMDADLPLRLLDLGAEAAPMAAGSGYPYLARGVPAGGYVPRGRRSIGVPDLLLCRPESDEDVVHAMVDVLATDAAHLVPPYVRGLQYLDPPAMIQTGRVPLHPGAMRAYGDLHG